MDWKHWRIGLAIAVGGACLTVGASLTSPIDWVQVVRTFCASCAITCGAYLAKHPEDEVK